MPNTPAAISSTSHTMQISTIGSTCWRPMPCRITNAFCGPIPTIWLADSASADKYTFKLIVVASRFSHYQHTQPTKSSKTNVFMVT
ncbi:hypothetical protein D3C86_1852550 [compost metagenome]